MATGLPDFTREREAMVERQLKRRGIHDQHILDAFLEVPREAFVDPEHAPLAYGDHPLPIEAGQTISQPYIVALMIEAAEIQSGDAVLEIGAGSGYAAALMSRIADRVVAIERHPELARLARERMQTLGFENVRIIEGDGTRGCSEEAPFDAILAAASGSHIPRALVEQLAADGRLVMPLGDSGEAQRLVLLRKLQDGSVEREELGAVRFVPLIGEEGWADAR